MEIRGDSLEFSSSMNGSLRWWQKHKELIIYIISVTDIDADYPDFFAKLQQDYWQRADYRIRLSTKNPDGFFYAEL